MIDYKDKIILITGASSGIGKACAFEFGILGATIALTGRNENKLISLKSKLTDLNINSHFFQPYFCFWVGFPIINFF